MTISSKERKEYFFEHLSKFYGEHGFDYRRGQNSFIKKTKTGNEFSINYQVWPEFMQVEPSYQIIIKEVENVKKKAFGKLYKKFCSVGQQKAYIIDNLEDSTSWTDNSKNLKESIKKENEFWNEVLEDYFERFSKVEFLDGFLNTNLGENLYIAFNRIHTIFLAIVVAYLNGNKNLEELIAYYSKIINKDNSSYMEEFNLLKKYVLES